MRQELQVAGVQEFNANLACRLRRRQHAFRAACSDAGYGKSECRRVPRGKTLYACLLYAPQPRTNFITLATECWIIGKKLTTIFKLADITFGLDFSPVAKGIKADVEQIGFGTMRKANLATG
jgi:hypothetical protein